MPKKKSKSKKRKKPAIEYRYELVQTSERGIREAKVVKQKWNADTQTWEAVDE